MVACAISGSYSVFLGLSHVLYTKPSLPKTVSMLSLWLSFLSKTLFPFLSCSCSPQDWGVSKKWGDWNWAGPCGALPSTKVPLCPHFLFVEKGFSLLGLPWVPKSRLKQLLTSSCAQHTVRPNKQKCQSLEQRKVYCKAKQGEQVARAQNNSNSLKILREKFL